MKNKRKIVTILMLLMLFASCGKQESANGQPIEKVILGSTSSYSVSSSDYYTNNIHYKVFVSANGDIFVVNISKDSLDIFKKNK